MNLTLNATLFLLVALVTAGCVSRGPSPEAIAAAEARGRPPETIRVGDTMEYVELQWGEPDDVDRMLYAGGASIWWRWCFRDYKGRIIRCPQSVHFMNGVVETIHSDD
jgi:hypothetical protein